jgi:hypothetical protein
MEDSPDYSQRLLRALRRDYHALNDGSDDEAPDEDRYAKRQMESSQTTQDASIEQFFSPVDISDLQVSSATSTEGMLAEPDGDSLSQWRYVLLTLT